MKVWDTLAIGEFLNEIAPKAGLLPKDRAKRAHCRSICGEMHSGFVSLRQALPMNISASSPASRFGRRPKPTSSVFSPSGASVSHAYGGPFLFGEDLDGRRDVRAGRQPLPHLRGQARGALKAYAERIWDLPAMREWREAALAEKEEIEELEVEF